MEYLTVGTNEIRKDLFIPVKENEMDNFKPNGGLWLTEYDEQFKNYNVWVDYLIDNPDILFYKNKSKNIWEQPCSLVTLKENTNIYILETNNNYSYLKNNYSLDDKRFSYELLAHKYDGIYVDILKLIKDTRDENALRMIRQFAVSSLVLFNVDCIDYYRSGYVLIEPFDFEYYMYESAGYEINYDKVKKKIR